MFIEKFARILAQRDEGLPHVSNFPQEIAKISQILKGSKQIQRVLLKCQVFPLFQTRHVRLDPVRIPGFDSEALFHLRHI